MKDGLDIDATFHFKETWDSNYVKDYLVEASPAKVQILETGGDGKFVKNNGDTAYATLGGYQTYLSNGNDVDLNFATSEGDRYRSSWYLSYSGTSKSRGDQLLGQRITIEDDSIFMTPHNTAYSNSWNVTPKQCLTEDDFEYRGFWVTTFDEFEGTYNSAAGTWAQSATASTAYDSYKPICVYGKTRGSSEYAPYCMVTKTRANSYRVNLWSGETDADGNPVPGDAVSISWGHYVNPKRNRSSPPAAHFRANAENCD